MPSLLSLDTPSTTNGTFDWGNAQLYKMCRETPGHTDPSVVLGKIWLIGRAYSASIERKADVAGKVPAFYMEKVAPTIVASRLDDWLDTVKSIQRLDRENLEVALLCHKRLTDLFNSLTGLDKRSLASKYLHFHAPEAFFIFDTLANNGVREKLGRVRIPSSPGNEYDEPYADFAYRCLLWRDRLEQQEGRTYTPRDIDRRLLGY